METKQPETATPQFDDRAGRNWQLALNFVSLAALRNLGIDLGTPHTVAQNWARLLIEDATALDALWALIAEQAAARKVTRDDWLTAMSGAELELGLAALEVAVVLFIRPQQRGVVTAGLAKLKEGHAEALAAAARQVAEINQAAAEQALSRLGISDLASLESLDFSTIAGRFEMPNKP